MDNNSNNFSFEKRERKGTEFMEDRDRKNSTVLLRRVRLVTVELDYAVKFKSAQHLSSEISLSMAYVIVPIQ